jgi:hypothetical protein
MANWGLTATFALNKYLWFMLKQELGWSAANYGGMVPITIPQQQPEFTNYNKPFIVYNFTSNPTGRDFYLLRGEQTAYAIYSANETDIRQVVDLMNYLFDRRDDSAADLNKWLRIEAATTSPPAASVLALRDTFDFKSIMVMEAQNAQPAGTEGGRMDGGIIVQSIFTNNRFNQSRFVT